MARKQVNRRRQELVSYKYRGIPLDRIAERLSDKYNVKERTIKRDWYNREEWIKDIFDINIDNPELLIVEIIAENREIQKELYKLQRDTTQDSVKLGVLKQLSSNLDRLFNVYQSVGLINKATEKIELSGKVEMESDEQIRQKFLDEINRVASRMDKEKVKQKAKNRNEDGGD